jgi:Ankyrin repeats (3 copies)
MVDIPPLTHIGHRGLDQLVREIESGRYDIEARDGSGCTALNRAAHFGYVHAVNILLYYGANAHTLNDRGLSTLNSAAGNGHAHIVKILHDNGVDAELPDAEFLNTPLHSAAVQGHVDVVRMLINFDVDQSKPDDRGRTALDYALLQYERFAADDALVSSRCRAGIYAEIVAMLSVAEEILKERCLAFAMGGHERLGKDSLMNELPDDVYNKIVKLRPFKKD